MNITQLNNIATTEYGDIVDSSVIRDENELRIILTDGSFIDIWFSLSKKGRYSYHWERKKIDGTIYRHDNVPHLRWKDIATYPKHFHESEESNVRESYISSNPEIAIREVLDFVRLKI